MSLARYHVGSGHAPFLSPARSARGLHQMDVQRQRQWDRYLHLAHSAPSNARISNHKPGVAGQYLQKNNLRGLSQRQELKAREKTNTYNHNQYPKNWSCSHPLCSKDALNHQCLMSLQLCLHECWSVLLTHLNAHTHMREGIWMILAIKQCVT